MGFEVTPPSKPIIREAASMQNDGGAGNLGYFEREENKEKKQQLNESIFDAGNEKDTFKKESDIDIPEEEFSISKFIAQIIFSIKEWFKKLT